MSEVTPPTVEPTPNPEAVLADCCGQEGCFYVSVKGAWACLVLAQSGQQLTVIAKRGSRYCDRCGGALADAPQRRYHWGLREAADREVRKL